MAQLLANLKHQLAVGEQKGLAWVTCSYIEYANRDIIYGWYRHGGYKPLPEGERAINDFWNHCTNKGCQVMPGCQGVYLADKSETSWYVEFHVDLRNKKK